MSVILTILFYISAISFGLVTATLVLKAPSPVGVAAPAETTDWNNTPGPMFCAPECQNIYDVCIGNGDKPEKECRDMSCVTWGWECGECALCKQ